ncbi:hypothetical protein AVEN_106021-1 [Araneus ventricosus]|uniref:Uncharacterized protein n=1 Tax=Araneus ventricosus TaxID=182803 RepID=A0A4Y2X2Y1_ARAVE|nr:hypothetical protein AVEN_106021-1 [Araneus ventricosus]
MHGRRLATPPPLMGELFTTIKLCSHGVWLGKPRVAYRFVLVECGRWNYDQSRRSDGAWLGKSLDSARVNVCTDAVWSLSLSLMCELLTAITREAIDALTSPQATSIFPVPTMAITRTTDGTCGKTGCRNSV